jgi:uncharacterized membrane protein
MSAHPLIVHFPIALLLTSILADLLALLRPGSAFKEVALFLLILGVIGAIAAGVSGDRASETIPPPPALRGAVEQHEDFGTGTIWLFLALLMARLYMMIKGRFVSLFRTVYLLLSLLAGGLLVVTGYSGGRLVYEYGAGTKPAMEQSLRPEK